MSAFDDLTLGEVDDIVKECLDGKGIGDDDVDPLKLAGAVMWAVKRKSEPGLTWDVFRYRTSMGDIRRFSELEMGSGEPDNPTNPPTLANYDNVPISGVTGG